jgi:ligand-binding SRPBCC domain-containing protein
MQYRFTSEQLIPHPLETVFAFFADPANLPRLMPTWQDARIDAATFIAPPPSPHPFPGSDRVQTGTGSRITLTIRPIPLSPIRLSWVSIIEDFRWLEGFCDIQLHGPFKYWRHCHNVTHTATGTRLIDAVEYEPPLGPLGSVANTLFIHHQLKTTFAYRHRRTLELLEQPQQ